MNKLLFISLFTLLFCSRAQGQPCWGNGVQLFSQYDVDNLKSISQGCTSVVGSVSIYGPNIMNLDSLSWITSIGGSLWISPNAQLTNLQGLSNLTDVGGHVNISGNAALENLTGLDHLQTIGGRLILDDNAQLSNIDGLNSLTSIGEDVYISNNPLLLNVDGLSNLTTIGHTVSIGLNNALVSLSGLDNLVRIGGDVYLNLMDNLLNLDGMNQLDSIGGTLYISECNQLSSISGFQNLKSIGGTLSCGLNNSLTSFSGLGNLDALGDSAIIFGNPLLTEISVLKNLSSIKGLIVGANPKLSNLSGLQNLVTVEGNLVIGQNESLPNLSGLGQLATVGGNLRFNGNGVNNYAGLENLKTVGGNVYINEYLALTSLTGLDKLASIGGALEFNSCHNLLNLKGLDSLKSVGGSLKIYGVGSLVNFQGLENLTSIGGNLDLYSNEKLANFKGLDSLKSVGKNIIIFANGAMTSLDGLENLNSASGRVSVTYNSVLSDCVVEWMCHQLDVSPDSVFIDNNAIGCNSALEVMTQCDLPPGQCLPYDITFNSQTAVDQFAINYPGCKEIIGDVVIDGPDITNLDSLIVLTALGKQLAINSTNLSELSGLDSLKSVGKDIFIQANGVLKRLKGLENLDSIGGRLNILGNPMLSACAVAGVCDKLSVAPDSVYIFSNAVSCNSPAEVKAECELQPGQCLVNGINFYNQASVYQFTINYPGCKEIIGDVFIGGSDISNLDSLSVLTSLGGGLDISETKLANLSGLENLTSIGGVFRMSNDGSITQLNALGNVTHIGGGLDLNNLPMLTSLAGLENSTFPSGASLYIANNSMLASLDKIGVFSSVIYCAISHNNTLHDLSGLETVDSIFGLYIGINASLNDLTALGNAHISSSCNVGNNTALTSLAGLENMVSLGSLEITGNPALTDLNPLSNLKQVAYCNISSNEALTDLSGLENIDSIGSLIITNNALLTNLTALGNAKGATACRITDNLKLTSLAGLENLDSLYILHIDNNPLLVNLEGLNNVANANYCTIADNITLSSLSGLENLKTANSLEIYSNPALINLEGLNSLHVVGSFYIYNNANLNSLAQFNSLDSMGRLRIYQNPALTNLNGLDSLKKLVYGWDSTGIATNLWIENNAVLTDIHSLQNLSLVKSIQINGNHSLSNCAIYPVCNRLATEPDFVLIENNAPGCNDPFEVETQCGGTIVSVTVLMDPDGDCQPAGAPAPHLLVHFTSPTQSVFRETNVAGTTRFILPAMDTFSLKLPQVLADKWGICEKRYLLQSTAGHDSISAFLLLKPLNQCPELTCNLSLPSNFRSCFTSANVQVSTRNSGTVLAEAVRTAIVIPPVLELLASIPLASGQNGDTLFFELGDLNPFETGTVQLTVKTKCDTFLLGQTLCWEAFSGFDNPCPNTLPAFSEIKLSASCLGDTLVRFILKNIGDAPTQGLHTYTILRNETVVQSQNFSLVNQQNRVVDVPADGATYRMEATKFDNGALTATALENCNGLTPGQINAFWLDEGPLEYDFDCRQVIGAYDPNQKTAVPTGAGQSHYITANRPIQYTIDFQNTGTDTAYRVLLRDVLPAGFDLNSFRPGISSHPCTWEIRGNLLEVLFSPIALPDSNVNEPGSRGFFSFELDQMPDLLDGTTFFNTASIIFDFNPEIVTNTVFHQIGQLTVALYEPKQAPRLW